MNITTDTFGKKRTSSVAGFVQSELLDYGQTCGELERIQRVQENIAKAVALIIAAMAQEGRVTARQVADLSPDYIEKAEFSAE